MYKIMETLMETRATIRDLLTDFLKHIIIVSSAILGIIVSLASPPSNNIPLFHAVVLLALLSILSGTIALYIVIIQYRTMDKDYLVQALSHVRSGNQSKLPVVFSKYRRIGLFFEGLCLVSFLLLMIALAWYSLFAT